MWSGWLCLGGNEVGNTARSIGYANSADCGVNWLIDRDCGGLADALGDESYEIGDITSAPWYDPRDPATSRFYGVYMLGEKGLSDSTRAGSYTEGIADGGVPGEVRYGGKSIRYRAWLTAMGEDALEAGMSWLDAALAPSACGIHGGSCGATDLSFFVSCPPPRRIVSDFSPWDEQFRNMFANPSVEADGGTLELYRNKFKNPEMTGSSSVQLYRNMVQNPELVGSGTVEVRRNLWADPVPVSPFRQNNVARWGENHAQVTVSIDSDGWLRAQANADNADGTVFRAASWTNDGMPLPGGVTITHSFEMEKLAGLPDPIFYRYEYNAAGTALVSNASSTLQTAPDGRRYVTFTTNANTAKAVFVMRRPVNTWTTGDWYRIRRVLQEVSSIPGAWFSGQSTSPDADLTPSWTGTVNASPSILSGVPVAGISTNLCIAIRSAKFGGSMRLIATSATDNNSYAELSPAPAYLAQQTLMATVNLEAALTGSLHAARLRLQSATPLTDPGAPPNAPGSYPQRWVATPTSQGRMLFRHGGLRDSGDVYWTKPALVPGNYAGPFFSGATPLADPDLTTTWAGTPNASESIVTGTQVTAGLPGGTADSARVYVSSQFPGAARVIPTSDTASRIRLTNYSFDTFQAGKTYTVLATVRLLAAQTGSLASNARSITAATSNATLGTISAPNAPGVYPLRLTFTVPATGPTWATVLLVNGAAAGGGDVYWEDVTVLDGAYAGPAFSGSNPYPDEDFSTSWVGTEDASESVVTAVRAPGFTGVNAFPVRSSRWAKHGEYSLRIVPRVPGGSYVSLEDTLAFRQTGGVAMVTAWLPAPVQASGSTFPSITDGSGNTAPVPNTVGEHDVRLTVPAGAATLALTAGVGMEDIWYDAIGLFAGEYDGPWFDGNSEGDDLSRYEWDGEENASTSRVDTRFPIERIQNDEEYDRDIEPLIRRLHNVITISGPLEIETRRSSDGKHWGRLVEFTLYAGMPWTFSETKELQLSLPSATVVQDTPFNLVTVPSAELAGPAVVAATNYVTNPSVEVNDNGWFGQTSPLSGGSTYTATAGRVVGELAAAGTASMRARLLGTSSVGSGRALHRISMTTDASARPAGSAVSVTVWGALVNVGGATGTTLRKMEAVLSWYPSGGGTPLSQVIFGESTDPATFGGRIFSLSSVIPPAGAVIAEVEVRGEFDWASGASPSDVRLYVDALGVTVP